ncbi:MAG TPA: MBL fold metallo-hydrolase [Vicinamibacterales bacterium]|nr:MBL fold metallo-hydrolase [Vicinamibacterales bacterium]
MKIASTLALFFLLAASAAARSQDAPNIIASYNRAKQLVDRAVAAHGGVEALRAARQMRVRFAGDDVWRHQSRAAAPPYDRVPHSSELFIDLEKGRVVVDQQRSYPGNIHRSHRFVTDGDKSYFVNHRHQTYTVAEYPRASTQINNLYLLPQLILLDVVESGRRIRPAGRMTLASGIVVDAVMTTTPNGPLMVGFHPETGRLHCTFGIADDRVAGLSAGETEFLDYRDLNGVLLPTKRVVSIGGEVMEERIYAEATPNYRSPDDLVRPPAGYTAFTADTSIPQVRQLGRDVWMVGGGSASLVVGFADHVLVVDAPPSSAAATIKQIASLAPGKPIRFVVPTHHHDDHSVGIRAYAGAGAKVVTTPGNQAFLEKIAGAPVEIITGPRVFSDATRTVEIHDIGRNGHSNEMLVAWLPTEGILFGGDLIDATASGFIERGSNNELTQYFDRWVQARKWAVRTYADGHGSVLDSAAFKDLLSRPVVPR